MREITYREAVREALIEEMERAGKVFLIGEDIGDPFGGSYKVTAGIMDRFGPARVRNAPLSEIAIVGAALGAAMTGLVPVAEIMYVDFTTVAAPVVAPAAVAPVAAASGAGRRFSSPAARRRRGRREWISTECAGAGRAGGLSRAMLLLRLRRFPAGMNLCRSRKCGRSLLRA